MQPAAISIGTSGWRFEDWAGTFYPLRVPKIKWLEYYAARFPVGEINSTYYRIAAPATYRAIAQRTPPNFHTFAKVHSDVTHQRQNPSASLKALLISLQPLRDAGKLDGLLAQFPGSFRGSPENLEYVLELRSHCESVPLCVEFRHRSWANSDVYDAFRQYHITWVCADEPSLSDLMPFEMIATNDLLYLRLHGRNAQAWYAGAERYNYNYSDEELAHIGRTCMEETTGARRGVIFFNNCHHGQAPRNAWWLQQWLAGFSAKETA
jgi:uncharacterized protein YecE (DUF72 family)